MIPNSVVETVIENGVATVTLNNPPANLLTLQLMAELEKTIDDLAENKVVRAIVITGGGALFAAGADVKVIASIGSSSEGEALALRGQALFHKIEQMKKPVIAAITGMCLGGGMELAMACHIRIAGDRTRMGQPEILLGILPGFGGTQRLPRLVGRAKATELILTGDKITAQEAKTIGLLNKVVAESDVLKEAQGMAKKIAGFGRSAVQASLEAIHKASAHHLSDGCLFEAKQFGQICETTDMKEGVSAFIQKRQPKFQSE